MVAHTHTNKAGKWRPRFIYKAYVLEIKPFWRGDWHQPARDAPLPPFGESLRAEAVKGLQADPRPGDVPTLIPQAETMEMRQRYTLHPVQTSPQCEPDKTHTSQRGKGCCWPGPQ